MEVVVLRSKLCNVLRKKICAIRYRIVVEHAGKRSCFEDCSNMCFHLAPVSAIDILRQHHQSRAAWREMKAHIAAIFKATPLSCMLYNNPVAYGTDFLPEHIAELAAEHSNFHSVKESST